MREVAAAERRRRTARLLVHGALAIASAATLFPLVWMLAAAFTPNDLILARPFRLWPEQATLANFAAASEAYPIWRWLWNSLLAAAAVTAGKLALSLPAAYAFARGRHRWRDAAFGFVIVTMAFPTVMVIVPTYLAVVRLGLVDTLPALIVPSIPYIGFYVFFFRQAMKALPPEMFEAASLDGAGFLRQFVDIALPNVAHVVPALAAFAFLGAWNIFLWGQLTLASVENKTLAVGVALFSDIEGAQSSWGPLMAVNSLAILPVLVVFLVARRSIERAFANR
ncbi:carbohydrate ABC transporter permease [Salinarimonas ramus]|uniref:ABC transporter permease n=1 Tax=Salinarimonas ramus TaxID=690164 RepID=A0A917Q728_9HYPH|nr:carbohydrate ABC transporter permease [Salinarimonas ramus]GGK25414.1 ABC transporter permease [Salinarimonas ramus]